MPYAHSWLELQALPHAPQLLVSVVKSVQVPLQQVWPEGQGQPLLQVGRAGHVVHFPFGAQYKPLQQLLFVSQPKPARWHLGMAKTLPMPLRPRMPPTVVAAIVLRAWRREVEVARALVRSSNVVGFTCFGPFYCPAQRSRQV